MTVLSSITIAIADDDEDDRLLIEDAFRESRLINPRIYAKDGVELMDYLEPASVPSFRSVLRNALT